MANLTTDNFLDLLGRSGLVDKAKITEVVAELAAEHPDEPAADGRELAARLVDKGLVTRWQADRLLEGRHRGFFLNKYKLLRHLGTGGMSSVYLAQHVSMRREVAIKVLPQSRVEDSSYLERFQLEAQAAGKLNHPHIVHTYDFDHDGKYHYIVMEYVPGRSLQEMVKEDGPLSYRAAADYIAQAAEGLEYAHDAHLVHRDIKPANLLVDDKDNVKILDMGLAFFPKSNQASLTLTHDENVLGTADYLPPEQAIDSHGVDSRADIYSLGCTLYCLLTGHPPFDEGSLAQRIMSHQMQEPPSIHRDRPDAPRELVAICQRMMAKKADDRYQTAGEVKAALESWLASASKGASLRPQGDVGSASAIERRRSALGGRAFPDDTISNLDRPTARGPNAPAQERSGGSSVIGRGVPGAARPTQGGSSKSAGRPSSSTKLPSQKLPPATPAEDLELAPLHEDRPTAGTSKINPAAKSPTTGSSVGKAPALRGDASAADKGASGAAPATDKPLEFGRWLEEELITKNASDKVRESGEHAVHGRAQKSNSKPIVIVAAVCGAVAVVVILLLLLALR